MKKIDCLEVTGKLISFTVLVETTSFFPYDRSNIIFVKVEAATIGEALKLAAQNTPYNTFTDWKPQARTIFTN